MNLIYLFKSAKISTKSTGTLYLVVMTALLGLAVIVIGAQAVWVAVRWVLLTALYYVLWPFAWLQQKFTA